MGAYFYIVRLALVFTSYLGRATFCIVSGELIFLSYVGSLYLHRGWGAYFYTVVMWVAKAELE